MYNAQKRDVTQMLQAYEVILDSISTSDQPVAGSSTREEPELLPEDLLAGMRALARDRNIASLIGNLQSMYEDIPTKFGYELTTEYHTALVLGLCRAGDVLEAVELFKGLSLDEADWTELLRMANRYDPKRLEKVWEEMVSRRQPHVQDYQVILRAIRKRITRKREVSGSLRGVLSTIQHGKVSVGTVGEAELARIYLLEGKDNLAQEVLDSWEKSGRTGQMLEREGWCAKLVMAKHRNDWTAVQELCLGMKECGYVPPGWAMAFLVQHEMKLGSTLEQAVDHVEFVTESATSTSGWVVLISDAVNNENTSTEALDWAMGAYRLARRRGVEIDTRLAESIVEPLSTRAEETLDAMVEVYEDILRSSEEADGDLEDIRRLADLTRILFKGCAAPKPPRSDMALRLLQEASERSIAIPNVRPQLVKLVRHSPNHNAAYELYVAYITNNRIDTETHRDLVNAFLTLSSSDGGVTIPPIDLAMEMMNHMRTRGEEPDRVILTSILSRYGQLASLRQNVSGDVAQQRMVLLRHIITVIHTRIKLGSIQTDVPLLNALMDAYNRAGAVKEALEVWDDLVERRRRLPVDYVKKQYPISISIALDTCAHRGLVQKAEKIWAWGKRYGLTSTTRVWNGWVESLCRMGMVERAVGVVWEEMGGEGVPKADVESVRIVAKFAWRLEEEERAEVRRRLEEAFPEYEGVIKGVMEAKRRESWSGKENSDA